MELHQLRYFVAVIEEGTFTAAAEAVRISQSGVSTQIQKLERELGLGLIDRSSRRVVPTPAGERLLPYARAALAAVEDVTAVANDIRGLVIGSLRVGTVTGLNWPDLFEALADLHTEHPGIDIRLREGNSDELIARVAEGTVDLAVAAWADREPADVRHQLIVDDPLVALVAPTHPWAGRTTIRPAELAGADLIALTRGTGARAALDGLLARAAATVEPRWEVATPSFVRMLAGRGLGVGIVSATTARDWDDLRAIPIDDPLARSRLGVIWRERPGHVAQALLRRLLPGATTRP